MNESSALFEIREELLLWASQLDQTPMNQEKYGPLLDRVKPSKLDEVAGTIPKILAVGSRHADIESLIADKLFAGKKELVCVDQTPPRRTKHDDLQVHWKRGFFPEALQSETRASYQALVCLASSRYFADPVKSYKEMFNFLRPGSPVIFDFLCQPLIRSASIQALAHWVFAEWRANRSGVEAVLSYLCDLSQALFDAGNDFPIRANLQIPALGFDQRHMSVQQAIYESFFPLWWREGATKIDALAMIVWQVAYTSAHVDESLIHEFCTDALMSFELLRISPDTIAVLGVTN